MASKHELNKDSASRYAKWLGNSCCAMTSMCFEEWFFCAVPRTCVVCGYEVIFSNRKTLSYVVLSVYEKT